MYIAPVYDLNDYKRKKLKKKLVTIGLSVIVAGIVAGTYAYGHKTAARSQDLHGL